MAWRQKTVDDKLKASLEADGIMPVFATIIANRRTPIRSRKDIAKFVSSPLSDLADPAAIPGAEEAARAISGGSGPAVVFGDYDVDGICSSHMLKTMLGRMGRQARVLLPDRLVNGYGLHAKSAETIIAAAREHKASLVVTVDCGSSSGPEVESIKRELPGAKVVVIDHHLIGEATPPLAADAFMNPRLGMGDQLCAAGLVYQLARLLRLDDSLLPLAALATVADVCELQGANRIIVKNGLAALQSCGNLGLRELVAAADLIPEKCRAEDMGFRLAPMVNAAGRIASPMIAFDLFDAHSVEGAVARAKELQALNEERKRLQEQTIREACAMADGMPGSQGLLLYSDGWHPGIVGIVAGHLAEKMRMPTMCFGRLGQKIVGSARSIPGVNVKEVMDSCRDLFLRYGGHEQAAGASLRPEAVGEASRRFDEAVREHIRTRSIEVGVVHYDAQISSDMARKLDRGFCHRLDAFEPFGEGNERPLFRLDGLRCSRVFEWKSGKGGFLHFDGIDMTCYASVPGIKEKLAHRRVDVLFSVERDFTDESRYAMRVQHARPASAS